MFKLLQKYLLKKHNNKTFRKKNIKDTNFKDNTYLLDDLETFPHPVFSDDEKE